jgi:hypothetical protein
MPRLEIKSNVSYVDETGKLYRPEQYGLKPYAIFPHGSNINVQTLCIM